MGRSALLLEFDAPDEVEPWRRELWRRRAAGDLDATEIVPAALTVLVDGVGDVARLRAELPSWSVTPGGPPPADVTTVLPVAYDGPDLALVAGHWGVPIDEVVARHLATEFRVAFCGFAPGFAYLAGLADPVPRLATPRTRVPAGSVALADRWCGVSPGESPGGWLLIGTTRATLFDVAADPPALLAPGDRVRFVREPG
jgi:KipI family sensor histidine kinase inhibitor